MVVAGPKNQFCPLLCLQARYIHPQFKDSKENNKTFCQHILGRFFYSRSVKKTDLEQYEVSKSLLKNKIYTRDREIVKRRKKIRKNCKAERRKLWYIKLSGKKTIELTFCVIKDRILSKIPENFHIFWAIWYGLYSGEETGFPASLLCWLWLERCSGQFLIAYLIL